MTDGNKLSPAEESCVYCNSGIRQTDSLISTHSNINLKYSLANISHTMLLVIPDQARLLSTLNGTRVYFIAHTVIQFLFEGGKR